MRAMIFDRYGDPDVMKLKEVAVPEPQEGEVLIRVGYAGVGIVFMGGSCFSLVTNSSV